MCLLTDVLLNWGGNKEITLRDTNKDEHVQLNQFDEILGLTPKEIAEAHMILAEQAFRKQ